MKTRELLLKYKGVKSGRKAFCMLLFFLLISPIILPAQDFSHSQENKTPPAKYTVGLFYGYGYIFRSDKFVEGENEEHRSIDKYQTFSARMMFQNNKQENKSWYHIYGFPYLGFGICVSDFYDMKEMGVPIALYGFINGPFHRWNKLTFSYEIDLGLTGNWRHFNPVNNPYNIAIGAERTVYFHAGIGVAYRFSPYWETEFNVGVAHFSNGAIKVPNFGLNTLSPRIELRYNVHGAPVLKKGEIPPFKRVISLSLTPFAGVKNVVSMDSVEINTFPNYRGVYFPIYGIRTTFNWQISYQSKFGVGMAVTYDGSEDARIVVENGHILLKPLPLSYGIRWSIFPSYELVIGPFSILFQPAVYIYRKHFPGQVPVFYQRIGFKYTLAHRVIFGVSLRAYRFQVSEFIEWGIGYQFTSKKK